MAVYACSDLHGFYGLYEEIKKILGPEDKVYFLGDANDRGVDGWKLMRAIYDDPKFAYIRGNHEQMFIDNAHSWKNSGLTDEQCYKFNTRAYQLVKNNGGVRTFDDWRKDGAPMDWAEKLSLLPLYYVHEREDGKKVFLSHAGCTLWQEKGVKDGTITLFDDLLWSREHIYDEWDEQCPTDYVVVHGHTPVVTLTERLGDFKRRKAGPYWYADGHKCCIDQGTFNTGYTCLLDLDTFEHKTICLPNFFDLL